MGWLFPVPKEQPYRATTCPQLASNLPVSNQISFSGNSSDVAGQLSINSTVKSRQKVLHVQEKKKNKKLSGQNPTDLMLLKSHR